jgi:hypothetical protein
MTMLFECRGGALLVPGWKFSRLEQMVTLDD